MEETFTERALSKEGKDRVFGLEALVDRDDGEIVDRRRACGGLAGPSVAHDTAEQRDGDD